MHKTPTWPSWSSLRAQAAPRPPSRSCPARLPRPSCLPSARARAPCRALPAACAPCAALSRPPACLPAHARPARARARPRKLAYASARPRTSTPVRKPATRPLTQHPSAQPSAPAPTPAHASAPACAPAARPAPACARPAPCVPSPAPSHQTQLGSSPSRFCTNFFFFSSFFFFHFFQPLENTKKYIFIYFLSFSSKPINLLKFISSIYIYIYIFPTNQINCLKLFHLFSCSSLHIVNSQVCFPTCLCAIYLSTQTFTSHIQHVIHTKQIHTTIPQSTWSHTKHTCRVLVLFRSFPR